MLAEGMQSITSSHRCSEWAGQDGRDGVTDQGRWATETGMKLNPGGWLGEAA